MTPTPLRSRSGQALSEYMILTLLIALGSLAAARTLGTTLRGKFEELNAQLQDIRLP